MTENRGVTTCVKLCDCFGSGSLLCPSCDGGYLHFHGSPYMEKDPQNICGDALCINFTCEGCYYVSRLRILPKKGNVRLLQDIVCVEIPPGSFGEFGFGPTEKQGWPDNEHR